MHVACIRVALVQRRHREHMLQCLARLYLNKAEFGEGGQRRVVLTFRFRLPGREQDDAERQRRLVKARPPVVDQRRQRTELKQPNMRC